MSITTEEIVTVAVSKKTRKRLNRIKVEDDFKSIDEVINSLIDSVLE
jgi:hypothetical protein|tara:strand:+ start:329 stop:469 length:141 start_codon:yes stop_codon:yes gene_type:complete